MNEQELSDAVAAEIAKNGDWRTGIYLTKSVRVGPPSPRTQARSAYLYDAVTDIIGDWTGPDTEHLLDLGSMHGALYLPFAEAGWQVTALEAREANCSKLRLLNAARGWTGKQIAVVQMNVVDLHTDWNKFDVINLSGLFYHLEAIDALRLLEKCAEAKPRILILDTHFARVGVDRVTYVHDGHNVKLRGCKVREYPDDDPDDMEHKSADKSVQPVSFHFHRAEIYRFLERLGFTTILQHAFVWEFMPPKTKNQPPKEHHYRKMLFCLGADR